MCFAHSFYWPFVSSLETQKKPRVTDKAGRGSEAGLFWEQCHSIAVTGYTQWENRESM